MVKRVHDAFNRKNIAKKAKKEAEAPVINESDDSDVEEADIAALARQSLKPGESILSAREDGTIAQETESRGICNAPLLLQKNEDIEYATPMGARRVPWVDTLAVDSQRHFPKGVTAKDGVKLESAFSEMALEAVREAYRRLRVMKVPANRPSDFYAEMLRSDKTMFQVRARASEEERRMKIVEDRKKAQAARRFSKKAKTAKNEARAGQKEKTLKDIQQWQQKSRNERLNADDKDLEDILNRQQGQKKGHVADQDGGRGKKMEKSVRNQQKSDKWGFGGKKKFRKSNDANSTNDMSALGGKKGKGKGKGKGKKGGGGPKGFRSSLNSKGSKGKGKGGGGGKGGKRK